MCPAAAGLIATTSVAGTIAGTAVAPKVLGKLSGPRAAAGVAATWLAVTAAAIALAAAGADAWLIALASTAGTVALSLLRLLERDAAARWGTEWLRLIGPAGRIGAALGAVAGTAAALSAYPIPILVATSLAVFASPAVTRTGQHQRRPHVWDWTVFTHNTLLAAAGYGPLVLSVALVAATAGPQWAGVSMAVYAVGAVASPPLVSRTSERWHRSPTAWMLLSGVANLTWLLVLAYPVAGLLASRFVSAVLLFAAEGSADIAAHRAHAGSSALAGRAVGALAAGSVGTMMLAAGAAVPLVAGAFAAIAGILAVGTLAASRIRRRSHSAAGADTGSEL